jgi:hypothetical protein
MLKKNKTKQSKNLFSSPKNNGFCKELKNLNPKAREELQKLLSIIQIFMDGA